MGARADLLATADGLAIAARTNVGDGQSLRGAEVATTLVGGAKTALEAAALAENMPVGAIEEALGKIQHLLEEAGVLAESIELDPPEFMDRTFRALLAWRREAVEAQAHVVAYDGLRELCERLERDFLAGDTATSRRIAGRIRTSLDEATTVINQATGGVNDGQG